MKFAVFDIDGTLVRDSIGVDFVNWLADRGYFLHDAVDEINKTIHLYDDHKIDYFERGKRLMKFWAEGVAGIERARLEKLAHEFLILTKYDAKIYSGSRELIYYFKSQNYYTAAITRSFEEIVRALIHKFDLGIEEVYGTKFEADDEGILTGNLLNEMWDPDVKGAVLRQLIKDKNLESRDSYAFGDTAQDISMLEVAEHPVVLHPKEKLREMAQKRGWLAFDDIEDLLTYLKKQ